MNNAFYYRGDYFLCPEGYADADAFQAAMTAQPMPCTVEAVPLFEDSQEFIRRCKPWNGLSMVPYFISDYLLEPMPFSIEDAADIFPVTVTLLTQKEYNARLRELVVDYCPGCANYGGVTEKDSSLEGHHTEISLDGVCLYRRTATSPVYDFLDRLPQRWPSVLLNGTADDILDFFFKKLELQYQSGLLRIHMDGARELLLRQPAQDVFLTGITAILNAILQRELGGRFSMRLTNPALTDDTTLLSLVNHGRNELNLAISNLRVTIGHLDFDPGKAAVILPLLSPAEEVGYLTVLCTTDSRIWLLFTEPDHCLSHLRYHSPALAACHPCITVCGPDGPETRRISFGMEKL